MYLTKLLIALAATVVVSLTFPGVTSGAELGDSPSFVDPGHLICVLPICDRLFSANLAATSDDQVNAEMLKLKEQIGQNNGIVRIGFSGIFQSKQSLERLCRLAKVNNLSLGVIIAVQTHSGGVQCDFNSDLRQYQWRLDGKTVEGVLPVAVNGVRNTDARDWMVPTASRYCKSVHSSAISEAQRIALTIHEVMHEYPGVIVVVDCSIEEELAIGGGNSDGQLGDYSPFAIAEFRDWLCHTGEYDDAVGQYRGQGAPAAIVGTFIPYHGGLNSPFRADLRPDIPLGRHISFDQWFGVNFTSWHTKYWDLDQFPSRITNPEFNPSPGTDEVGNISGGFDAPRSRDVTNKFWNAWSWDVLDHAGSYPPGNPASPAFGFRQVEVKHFVSDIMTAAHNAGIPWPMLYSHQIPAEAVSASRLRSGADPIWTGYSASSKTLGITRFGSIDTLTLSQYSDNWGIFEWHPLPGAGPEDLSLYSATITDFKNDLSAGCHVLFPGWWIVDGPPDTTFPLETRFLLKV